MVNNTTKRSARMIASLLARSGISDAVLSPGSRDVPLIVALERQPGIATRVVVDERSAAFIALGISIASGNPVAMVCTSGTAPLNYAPALAEAFYQHIPLIAITADRPSEWIGQDDSQTIIQTGIFENFTKGTFDIPVESDDPDRMWYINRSLNDAINTATSGIPGPVHINMHFSDPLGETAEIEEPDIFGADSRYIERGYVPHDMSSLFEELGARMAPPARILIVAGYMKPDNGLSPMLCELSRHPNIVVTQEAQSCLHGYGAFITNVDSTLRCAGKDNLPVPDIVITLGGSLTSALMKSYLRRLPATTEHWSINAGERCVDTFRRLTRIVACDEHTFINGICRHIPRRKDGVATTFKTSWLDASATAGRLTAEALYMAPWSDFKAMGRIMAALPKNWWLHIGNGMAVRYLQCFDYGKACNVSCNRGVSGIDGSTSTAIGVASACGDSRPVILISGDMSMQYDIGALATADMPANLKIIVINNGGGGIFRFIKTTRDLDELDRCLACEIKLPLKKLAQAFGFRYYCATDSAELEASMKRLTSSTTTPVILEVVTDGTVSAGVFTDYLKNKLTAI